MRKVAIIGAGQLGSRHLQSLATLGDDYAVEVMDPNASSLTTAKERYDQVASSRKPIVSYFFDLQGMSQNFDVVIVATSSKIRRKVVEELLRIKKVRYFVLEKVLFTRLEDYDFILSLIKEAGVKAWVNCPRRSQVFYKEIKNEIAEPFHMTVSGNGWGMGCNSIHFLDLFSFLSDSYDIKISLQKLHHKIIPSKREGYIEFLGTLEGGDGKNSFIITCHEEGTSSMTVFLDTSKGRYLIREAAKTIVSSTSFISNWVWKDKTYDMLFQSQLSAKVVQDLIETGSCELTPLGDSSILHKKFISELLKFQSELENNNIEECLIT